MNELTNGDKKLLADIERVGWHVVMVPKDNECPSFGYSIGLFKTFSHPEIIITGLDLDLIHVLINNIGEEIRNGKQYESEQLYDDILENYDVCMLSVGKTFYTYYVGYGKWYYKGDNFPLLQCVYPNNNGIFPWQKDCPVEFRKFQPVLNTKGNN